MSLLVLILTDRQIGISNKGHTLKGFPWKCFPLCSSLDNRMWYLWWMYDDIYLFETAHKVVTDWWPWKVCCARTASNIEKVIRAQHGVVFLCVSRSGQNSIHWYCHLDNKAQGKDTLYSDLHTGVWGYAWFWDLRRNPFSCLFEVWSWILVSYP